MIWTDTKFEKDTTSYFAKYFLLYSWYNSILNLIDDWYYDEDKWREEQKKQMDYIKNEMTKDFNIPHRNN